MIISELVFFVQRSERASKGSRAFRFDSIIHLREASIVLNRGPCAVLLFYADLLHVQIKDDRVRMRDPKSERSIQAFSGNRKVQGIAPRMSSGLMRSIGGGEPWDRNYSSGLALAHRVDEISSLEIDLRDRCD